MNSSSETTNSDMLFLSRVFYFVVHIFSWMLLFIYDNPYRQMITNYQLLEPIIFAAQVFYSNYLFLTVGKDTGNGLNMKKIVLEESKEQLLEIELQNHQESITEDNVETTVINIELDSPPQELPQKQFCQKCEHFMNYRTKHCNICKKCVPKFDHHCFWVGGCIGELNHRWFYLFLIIQTNVHIMLTQYFWQALDMYSYIESTQKDGTIIYSKEYGAYFTITMLIALLTLFTGCLLIYHTYLLLNGLTTWEHAKRSKISYLKAYPASFHPFNFGLIKNIRMSLFHSNLIHDWTLPPLPDTKSGEKQMNFFNNEYYSCC